MKRMLRNIVMIHLRNSYPEAEYVEASDWQIEDDMIKLTETLHIQVSCPFVIQKSLLIFCEVKDKGKDTVLIDHYQTTKIPDIINFASQFKQT